MINGTEKDSAIAQVRRNKSITNPKSQTALLVTSTELIVR
jgi:hypothetical protein